jgi:pilus assembly protein CpaE
VGFLLKLKVEYHLGDVLRDWNRMDNDLWGRLTIRSSGIDVLAAPSNPAARIEVTPQAAGELWAFWRERYQVVVLDLADVRSAAETGFAGLSDAVLLVSANELGSLQATRRAVDYLDQSMADRSRLRLILNRSTPSRGMQREDVRSALGLEPFAILEDDWATLQMALLEGRPAPESSRFSIGVAALCRQLRSRSAPVPARPEKKNGSWLSLLRHHNKVESVEK